MSLNIKNKLILLILAAVLLCAGGIASISFVKMTDMAETAFVQSSLSELQQVDNFISEFMHEAELNALFLSMDPGVQDSAGHNPNFTVDDIDHIYRKDMDEHGKRVFDLFQQMKSSHSVYANVYVGMEDGGFNMAPEDALPKGYDPRQRPWYKEAVSSSEATSFSKAYQSTTGGAVSTVTAKVLKSGRVVGVVGFDINLSTLTDVVSSIRIGESGYIILMEGDNTILSDPVNKDYAFKQADELEDPGMKELAGMDNGFSQIMLDGREKFVRVYTSPSLGWKLALLIDKSEIMADANSTVKDTLLMGLGIALVLCLFGWFVAKSIASPIQMLVGAAQSVSNGDFDAIPDESRFSGELLTLQQALKGMVVELGMLLKSTEEKNLEAEEQTKLAKNALAEAEEARTAAEAAKREGMLQAANHLEEIVDQITGASQKLSAQIEQSRGGAEVQRERSAEAATAMEEMNASVFEVAQNASRAAESADDARKQAENGGGIVGNVVASIAEVDSAAAQMSVGLESLGKRAEGIGQVMNVITDIADQTNLLALNAAIEAARAGEAGRGFAVVADEVRKLAEKTMDATKEVGEAVSAIQSGTRNSITDMKKASGMVERSTSYASEAGEALSSIVTIVESTADQVRAIATASEEQSAASEEINRNTDEVNRIAGETAQAMEQSARAVHELSSLSEELQRVIDDLKQV